MLIPLPNGAKLGLASAFAAAQVISAITNANPGVASAAAHTMANGDVILVNSPGWPTLDSTVRRVAGQAAGTFQIAGVNTTDVAEFPAGGGAGSALKVSAWTPLPKIPTFGLTGGDPKAQTQAYLDYDQDVEFFTGATPQRLALTMSYDPDGAAHAALIAQAKREMTALRLVLKSGATLYYCGQLFFNPSPTTTKDEEMVVNVSMALQGVVTRYAA